ncbi:Ribosome assembly protein SQT1 [Nakaseomyces bracarensis]|uniref:Ribosome assembly protein SQT1 n=1 Tax=Nakaseomyces bracarensis TaxID=273131 RepID=A0ABR4NXH4_9SACH
MSMDEQERAGSPADEYIGNDEVEQVIEVEGDEPEDMDMEPEDAEDEGEGEGEGEGAGEGDVMEETVEVDLSNNSRAYFDKHTDSVFVVTHHPQLPLVASGGGDNLIHLWTSHSQPTKFAGTLEGHTESVIAIHFTPDGKFLVSADMTGKVLVHVSLKGGAQWKLVSELQEVEEIVWLKVHPKLSGAFAFGATDGSVWCYQINGEGAQASLEQLMSGFSHQSECTMGEFINIEQSEELGTLELVTCSLDSTIVGWNCYNGQANFKVTQAELKGMEVPWISLAVAPSSVTNGNGGVLACGSNNGIIAILNCNNNGAVLHMSGVIELKPDQEELDASIESIAWAHGFPMMAIGLVGGEILLYDTNMWRVRRKFVMEDSATKLTFDSRDNLFVSCINGKVYEYDPRTGQEKFVYVGHNMGVLDFALTEKDDTRRLITAGDEGVSLIFDIQ